MSFAAARELRKGEPGYNAYVGLYLGESAKHRPCASEITSWLCGPGQVGSLSEHQIPHQVSSFAVGPTGRDRKGIGIE